MTALADITAAINASGGRLRILVGDSARRALAAEMPNRQPPTTILGHPVVETDQFRGWEIERRGLL